MISERLERFTRAERTYHWTNACAVLFQLVTGAIIWRDLDDWRINHINVISRAHFWLGLLLIGGGGLLFLLLRRRRIPASDLRFNRGQWINLHGFQVLLGWMILSGILLQFGKGWHIAKPTLGLIRDAHLVAAAMVLVGFIGHMGMVFVIPKNRGIILGMLTGWVERPVAERSSPVWTTHVTKERP